MDAIVEKDEFAVARESNQQSGYLLPDHWIIPQRDNTGLWWLDHEAYVSRVCEIVKESGAKTVLEAGCGDGWNCQKLVECGLEAVGCDWSQNAVDHARRMVPDASFYCGDLTDREFRRFFSQRVQCHSADRGVRTYSAARMWCGAGKHFTFLAIGRNVCPDNSIRQSRKCKSPVLPALR